jgi:hypothetical protein
MGLAVLFACVETQEHLLAGSVSWPKSGAEGVWSPLAGDGKCGTCCAADYDARDAKKVKTASHP